MLVKILVTAPYADPQPHGKMGARVYADGAVVAFPDAYAAEIIAAGLAVAVAPAPEPAPSPRRRRKSRE